MSKFFKAAYSSSESSDSEESVEEQPIANRPHVRDFAYPSDSDDEGPKRVVRAQKDKMYGDLKEQIRLSRNARNIKDISKLLTVFEALSRHFEKTKTVIAREGLTIPRFYIRHLVELEDFVNEQWEDKEGRKNMSKANAKSLASLRQKIRKYNKEFETEIGAYREGPDPVGYSSGAAEDDDDEEREAPGPAPIPAARKEAKKNFAAESDVSDNEWPSDDDESSSGSDIDLEGKQMEDLRKYFLKKDQPGKKERDEKKEGRERRQREAKEKTELATDEEDTGGDPWKKITHKDDAARPLFDPKTEITGELVVKKLHEINASRGRKSTNRKTHVKYLEELYKITDDNKLGAGILAKILCSVISALFELNTRISDAMDFKSWSRTLETVRGLYTMLVENQNVQISISVTEDDENLTSAEKPYRMHGSIVLLVKRLDDELTKIFQNADCHSTDYIEKLKGERELCSLIEQAQEFVDSHRSEGWFDPDEVATIYMLRIEHAHYKFAPENDNGETERLLDDLCKVVYSLKNAMKQRQRAMLCQIYHHAIHDRWHKAKDLLLMSHLQALADHSDASTQILYNRAICQVGLCAFRHGFIREAHQSLSEIQNTQRAKELLAQGTPPRQLDKTAEQETKERSMQVPYHMHINLELMECVYLICSMLLEIPNIACHEYDVRRRLLSRSFHYQLKFSEKSALIGPPENTREHVVAASRAMLKGDWRKCRDYIINDKMNAKVWNLFRNSPKVKEMVIQRIQEETLRTYLLMYTTIYNTVSLDTLCELFELKRQRVYAIISKMIIQEELSATLDEPTNCLIMHRIEPSRLQLLALSLTDKLAQLADNNEQIIEPRGTRTGYTVPGSWYAPRQDRGADDKNRRAVGGMFQGDRRGYGQDNQKRNWNSSNQQRRRGDMKRY